jgi:hypothetical protein
MGRRASGRCSPDAGHVTEEREDGWVVGEGEVCERADGSCARERWKVRGRQP